MPPIERIFDKEFLGRKWKHVIEPRAAYHYVTGINNFNRILRFDARDILSNTNEVEYAVVNQPIPVEAGADVYGLPRVFAPDVGRDEFVAWLRGLLN